MASGHRKALLESISPALAHYVDSYNNKTMKRWGPEIKKRGIQKVTFSKSEIAAFKKAAAAPAASAWIKANSKRGLPAQELYNLVTGMIAKGS